MRKFVIGFIIFLALLFISNIHFGKNQSASSDRYALALAAETDSVGPVIPVSSQVNNVLEQSFCSPRVCAEADWRQWIVVTPESRWKTDELVMLNKILTAVIDTLNQQGLDGHALLKGYRFRRQAGEYLVDRPGLIAEVNHTTKEITLADAAFKRLHGFCIIHELGHVVDQRTGRQLSATFHALIGSDIENQATAAGFWMNLHAKDDLGEATADAFALWTMATHAPGYRPVFAYTPLTTDFDGIAVALVTSLDELSLP